MEEKQRTSFLIGFVILLVGFLARFVFRSFIIGHGIDDFGLSAWLPRFLYVIGFSQILLIRPIKYPPLVMVVVAIGSIVYEYKKYYLSGKLDINIIVASILGGVVSYLILLFIEKKFKNLEK